MSQAPLDPHLTLDDDNLLKPKGRGKTIAIGALVAIVAIVGIGMVGQLSGSGFFGHRTWMYGQGSLYVLNFKAPELEVSIDGRPAKAVPFENAQLFDLVGGTSQVVIKDKSGKELERYSVTAKNSHALLKLGPDTCAVVLDLDPYYNKKGQGKLSIVARVMGDQQVYVPNSQNVVWPNKDFPSRFNPGDGPSRWIEKVACQLLDPSEEHMLLAYMEGRLQNRMNRFKAQQNKTP